MSSWSMKSSRSPRSALAVLVGTLTSCAILAPLYRHPGVRGRNAIPPKRLAQHRTQPLRLRRLDDRDQRTIVRGDRTAEHVVMVEVVGRTAGAADHDHGYRPPHRLGELLAGDRAAVHQHRSD